MSFGDLHIAARTREAMEFIATSVVRRERPESRSAQVYSYDPFTKTAQVIFPGDPAQVKINVPDYLAPTKTLLANPTDNADIVSVGGKPGGYYLERFVSGTPALSSTIVGNAPDGGRFGLHSWYSALGDREIAPAEIVMIGDSITEGTGASGYFASQMQKLQTLLRARYPSGTVGGQGYIASTTAFAPVPPVVLSTGINGQYQTSLNGLNGGLGMKVLQLKNNGTSGQGATATWGPYTCDRVRVFYTQPDAFAGNGTVWIDGVQVATLTGFNTPYRGGQMWDSGALALGAHTVMIRGEGAFHFNVEAVEFFNGDYNKGIHVYDGAHFGFSIDKFLGVGPDRSHWSAYASILPQLTIINLGTNDILTRTGPAMLADIDTMLAKIATLQGTNNYSVLLVQPYRPSRTSKDNTNWSFYRAGLAARVNRNVAVFDLNSSWPDLLADGSTNHGLMAEATNPLHPSRMGQDYIANLLFRAISL